MLVYLVYDSRYVDKKVFISSKDRTNLGKLLELVEENLPQEIQKKLN